MSTGVTPNLKFKYLLCVVVAVLTFILNRWTCSSANGWLFDDFSNFYRSVFTEWIDLVSLIPESRYNDRPVGLLVIKGLHQLFGINFNPVAHFLLFTHCINAILVLLFLSSLSQRLSVQNGLLISFVAALLFGSWPTSIMAVQWMSAMFDLVGCTFVLLTLIFYLRWRDCDSRHIGYGLLAVVSFILGVRAKEAVLGLPIFLAGLEVAFERLNTAKRWLPQLKNKDLRLFCGLSTIALFYIVVLATLDRGATMTHTPDNPYYYKVDPVMMLSKFWLYVTAHFDVLEFRMNIRPFSTFLWPLILSTLVIAGGFFSLVARNRLGSFVVVLFCGAFAFLFFVLPMRNLSHISYLYMPSIFLSTLPALVMVRLFTAILPKAWLIPSVSMGVVLMLVAAPRVKAVVDLRKYWSALVGFHEQGLRDALSIPRPPPGTTVYVRGVPKGYSFFRPYPQALPIVFGDRTISVVTSETADIKMDGPWMEIVMASPWRFRVTRRSDYTP